MVAERCEFLPGDLFDGKYRIVNSLGEGTFGVVYRAKNQCGEDCAIKLLKLWTVTPEVGKDMRGRFVMEFETGKIKSNYLAHSYSYGEVKGNPYIHMEYCPNGDLRSYVEGRSVDYIKIARNVLCGLGALHAHGKVHRDLKPENVLLRKDNTAVLTDFGISGDQNKRMTERGAMGIPKQVFGTYPYMPPEQVNPPRGGHATVLPTTDIYSFGVMMYEMIVGGLPYGPLTKDTLYVYLMNSKNGNWDRASLKSADKSGVWLPIIEGCLQPDYKLRTQTVEKILSQLPSDGAAQKESASFSNDIYLSPNGLLLRIMQGEEYGRTYKLKEIAAGKLLVTMGRADACVNNMIALKESLSCYVSRRHCSFEYDAISDQWYIRDGQWVSGEWKESLNGTYVNSTEADKFGVRIIPGDIISVGDIKLRVEGY